MCISINSICSINSIISIISIVSIISFTSIVILWLLIVTRRRHSVSFFYIALSLYLRHRAFYFFFIILVSSVSVGEGPLYCKVFADNVFAETFSDRSTESLGWKFYENRVKFDLLDIF